MPLPLVLGHNPKLVEHCFRNAGPRHNLSRVREGLGDENERRGIGMVTYRKGGDLGDLLPRGTGALIYLEMELLPTARLQISERPSI